MVDDEVDGGEGVDAPGVQGRVALHALEIANGDATGEAHGYRLEFWSTASAATKGGVLDLQAQVDGPLFTVAAGPFAAKLTSARAGGRTSRAAQTRKVAALITEPWRAAHLRPLVTEGILPPAFEELVGRVTFRPEVEVESLGTLPAVEVESLGTLSVRVAGHEVDTQAWESRTALELYRGAVRREADLGARR